MAADGSEMPNILCRGASKLTVKWTNRSVNRCFKFEMIETDQGYIVELNRI